MTFLGYTVDGEVLAGLMFAAALLLLWVGLSRRPSAPETRRHGELTMDREGEGPPPSADGPRGPWG